MSERRICDLINRDGFAPGPHQLKRRRTWPRCSRPAWDLAAVGDILRRGLTDAQAAQTWREAAPDIAGATEYVRAILRRARALLAQGPKGPHDKKGPKPP